MAFFGLAGSGFEKLGNRVITAVTFPFNEPKSKLKYLENSHMVELNIMGIPIN